MSYLSRRVVSRERKQLSLNVTVNSFQPDKYVVGSCAMRIVL